MKPELQPQDTCCARWSWVENYFKRIEQLQRVVDDANLLAENIKPDFYHKGKEPGFMLRSNACFALHTAKVNLDKLKSEWMTEMGNGKPTESDNQKPK